VISCTFYGSFPYFFSWYIECFKEQKVKVGKGPVLSPSCPSLARPPAAVCTALLGASAPHSVLALSLLGPLLQDPARFSCQGSSLLADPSASHARKCSRRALLSCFSALLVLQPHSLAGSHAAPHLDKAGLD
jgi:hypothetical protein